MKNVSSSRVPSLLLATSDSFPTTEQHSQDNDNFEEIKFNATEEHYDSEFKNDNDKALPSDVFQDSIKSSDQLEKESLVKSRTQGAPIETVVERYDKSSKEKVDENIDTIAGIAKSILLDSISTNSGING